LGNGFNYWATFKNLFFDRLVATVKEVFLAKVVQSHFLPWSSFFWRSDISSARQIAD